MSENSDIKFGTDGWRGVISRDFTFENVRWVTQAIVDYLISVNINHKGLIVGYDRRFMSRQYAEEVASVAAANGLTVYISDGFAPTPAISWAVKEKGVGGGIIVTASHNPPEYNGIKFKESFGGSAPPETTVIVEKLLRDRQQKGDAPLFIPYEEGVKKDLIVSFEPMKGYMKKLKSFINLEKIRDSGIRVAVDPMHGAGAGCISRILGDLGIEVKEIRAIENPVFGGGNPEPIDHNLGELMALVKEEGYDVGLATDGDADRIGAVDGRGEFFNSHKILTLLLKHMIEERGETGNVVKAVSSTRMIDILAEKYGISAIETPIGFKHICKKMLEGGVLVGGEESGGIGISSYLPERDGILIALILVEIMAVNGKGLEGVLDELFEEIGIFCYDRIDLGIAGEEMLGVREKMARIEPKLITGIKVDKISRMDGTKFFLADGSWLLLRASGTEPLLRIYAESSSKENVDALLNEGKNLLGLTE